MRAKSALGSALAVAAALLAAACATAPPTTRPTDTPIERPSLMVAKWADKEQAVVGEHVTCRLVVMNDQLGGEDPGAQVQLQDTLPDTLDFLSGSLSPEATYDEVTRSVRWSGQVPQGGSMYITFGAVLSPAAGEMRSVINTVVVTDALGQVTEASAQTQVIH